jgi:flagellar basal body rod protein FlgG
MFGATANNIANVNTEGYKPPEGVQLTEELPAMMMQEVAYTALARVIKNDQALSGALIDMLA